MNSPAPHASQFPFSRLERLPEEQQGLQNGGDRRRLVKFRDPDHRPGQLVICAAIAT
jgi:hypothetical protein